MVKIIYIGNINGTNGLQNRMDKGVWMFLDYLKTNSRFEIHLCDASEKNHIDTLVSKNNILIVLAGCMENYVKNYDCVKIYETEDVKCRCGYLCTGENNNCRSKVLTNYIKNMNYDYVFNKYNTYIIQNQLKNQKLIHFPFFNNDIIFNDKKEDKIWDILLYGNIWQRVYPFRYRLHNLLLKSKFKIKIIDHPEMGNEVIVGEELSKIINQSWITICTKSINNLLLRKYFEVALSKSVICGNYPDLEEKYFDDCMIVLDEKMKDNEIINKIDYYLQNKNNLIEMANKSFNIAMSKFTHKHGLMHFEKIIDNIIHEKKLE